MLRRDLAYRGDSTFFRHIDLNIPTLVADKRGHSLIQGSLSLDNEHKDDCTEILLGMHRHLGTWWNDVVKRGARVRNGPVIKIDNTHWSKADKQKFGLDFILTPCKAEIIRVSLPYLPHGTFGPAKYSRRTVLL